MTKFLPQLDELTGEGLVILDEVTVIKYVRKFCISSRAGPLDVQLPDALCHEHRDMTFSQLSKVPDLIKRTTAIVAVFGTTIAALAGVGSFVSLAMRTLL